MRIKKNKFKKINFDYLNFIIICLLIFNTYLIFFYKFEKINIYPLNLEKQLISYFQNKNFYQIYLTSKELIKTNPQIKKISIKPNFLTKIVDINIKESKIIALICNKNNCFYLDNYGEIINNTLKQNKNNLIKIYSYLPIYENTLLNQDIKNFLSILFEYSNWKPFILKTIIIYPNFDVSVIDLKDRVFLFDLNKNLSEQIKKLHIFLDKNFEAQKIDLRISKKIFYQ